ncbi:hypothetical protein CC86DRAFT_399249 [Ophiobolus disseminans]|uniref:Zn(2)-C6 fungal-type domain-containing protein n=1 Tax=Ophiobolus disseminans TaxID=1469910 RepID=A0A6A6ZDQ2_9PLEO|nr:hypothetical protein CC86DRAFT_399249 [Ophiobolus disseminans]
MSSVAPIDPSGGRHLPTRVSNACDRCRRNKSRCDSFRPCSLCARAKVECFTGTVEQHSRPAKRKRTRGTSCDEPFPSIGQDGGEGPVQPQPKFSQFGTGTARGTIQSALDLPSEPPQDVESRRPSVTDGQVDSAMGIAQKLSGQGTPVLRRTTSAIPGGDMSERQAASRSKGAQRRPIETILGYRMPDVDKRRLLMEEYFDAVHWFSLVIYEPRFRRKFESIEDGKAYPSQKSFLLLLSVVLGMGAWYRWQRLGNVLDLSVDDWRPLVQNAGSQLTDLMDHASIESVQACILLGSHYVYHGKPNLSFSLLGATIRTAQAIRLHREPLRSDFEGTEERKRVWWTIYTWDRFASVTYGRPLGINDKDCNVAQPIDAYESPYFRSRSGDDTSVCYSSYQRELNRLYMLASPIIETIFGMRATKDGDQDKSHQYLAKVMDATERLWAWRRHLPPHLILDLSSDCEPNYSRTSKVHRLQALALQLTFDNLLIIFHRPSLAQQVDHLIRSQPEHGQASTSSPASLHHPTSSASPLFAGSSHSPLSVSQASSTEQWWDAALRTSKVTELPQLAQLATDSHLVAFLAINLFNSAIVMAVLALSDPLSDTAQEVKRSITRIYRLQELLGKRTELSMQSNVVLKDVIHMLLQREADAMLAPILTSDTPHRIESISQMSSAPLLSVEHTLRLPIQLPTSNLNHEPIRQSHSTADKALRLNESLASVQKVLPFAVEGLQGDDMGNIDDQSQGDNVARQVVEGSCDTWFDTNLQSLDEEADWGGSGNFDITGSGLYWFWDSAWGEHRS